MNALPQADGHLTLEEYLEYESASDVRHEYVNGEVYAFAGASVKHAKIVSNILGHVWNRLRGGPCTVASNDVKVQVADSVIYYPDVVVTCDPTDAGPLILYRPNVIVEVLSPSTASTDRREKAMLYLQMPTLLCYMIVYQDAQRVDLHWRPDIESSWNFELVIGRPVKIPGIDMELPLDDIYEGVETDPAALIQ